MTTAQRILARHNTEDFRGQMSLESELREICREVAAPNCYDRTWKFSDGSTVNKTREGFTAGAQA